MDNLMKATRSKGYTISLIPSHWNPENPETPVFDEFDQNVNMLRITCHKSLQILQKENTKLEAANAELRKQIQERTDEITDDELRT
jgi:hypothetical protein